jgi:hypothetical protein
LTAAPLRAAGDRMVRSVLPPTVLLLALAASALAADAGPAPYEVVTAAGDVLPADSIEFAGDTCLLTLGESATRLDSGDIDYYRTFRRNADRGSGNVVVFRTGAFFRFESLDFARSQLRLGLGEQGQVTVPEGLIDFEQSVREGATVRLPRANERVDVVRAGSGGGAAATARGRSGGDDGGSARSRAIAASRGGGSARLGGPEAAAGRRSASLRQYGKDRFEVDDRSAGAWSDGSSEVEAPAVQEEPEEESVAERVARRDGIADAEEVRREAEEQGEPSGRITVVVSSGDAAEVAAVQFRLRYPGNCTPTGAQPIGSFANASMAQPNGSVGGRPLMAMAIVLSPDTTTSLPGEIARVDFIWTSSEPPPDEFTIVSASASDERGNPIRGFRVEAVVLQ